MAKQDDTGSTCNAPRCRKPSAIGLRGRKLCDDHWGELCKADATGGDYAAESMLARWGFPARGTVAP